MCTIIKGMVGYDSDGWINTDVCNVLWYVGRWLARVDEGIVSGGSSACCGGSVT